MKKSPRVAGSAICLGAWVLAAASGGIAQTSRPVQRNALKIKTTDWRQVATPADRSRLRGWRQAWMDALGRVPAGIQAGLIAADPALFDPDRALPGATPPPGAYACRVFKLGANGTAMRNVTTYPVTDCAVEDDGVVSTLYKSTGAQRPVGLLFPDSPARAIFLGTMVLGDETKPRIYGQDANRDMAGYVERIGDKRWRLVLPRPRFESLLDVVEIVPRP